MSKYGIRLTAALHQYNKYEDAVHASKNTVAFSPDTREWWAEKAKEYMSLTEDQCVKITEWIDRVEKGCRARKIGAIDVLEACADIEEHLGITKKALNGCSFDVNLHGQQFPNAYRGQPDATWFTVEYHSGNWYLSSVGRGTARASHIVTAHLTEEAKAAIVNRYQKW